MSKFIDLTGKRFGRLVVLNRDGEIKPPRWNCICDCGNRKSINGSSLKRGLTESCGCYRDERIRDSCIVHGLRSEPIYAVWRSMVQRCTNKNVKNYNRYGGRGIVVCSDWLTPINFLNWAIDNGYEHGLTIDRIDNDGNYCPDNCRWVTTKENNRNSTNCKLNEDNVSIIKLMLSNGLSPLDVANEFNVSRRSIYDIRLGKSWPDVEEMTVLYG